MLAMTKGVFRIKSYEMTPIKGWLRLEAGTQSVTLRFALGGLMSRFHHPVREHSVAVTLPGGLGRQRPGGAAVPYTDEWGGITHAVHPNGRPTHGSCLYSCAL